MRTDNIPEALPAARAFGLPDATIEVISEGLIHRTLLATSDKRQLILQQINTQVFPKPEKLISNYLLICNHLKSQEIFLPEPVADTSGNYLFADKERVWRATAYVSNTQTIAAALTPEQAFEAASCFARYTAALTGLPANLIQPVIPGFHNLQWRYQQFEEASFNDVVQRKKYIPDLISRLRLRKHYVTFYQNVTTRPHFRQRIMHCDSKTANILFDKNTQRAVCPVDWDTVMPGYYFSDLGDLIRSTCSTVPESSTHFTSLAIREEIYRALTEGYLHFAEDMLTPSEKHYLHHAGLLMTYMQALRFATDYLNGDVYYQTTCPEQNLHRAINQCTLLKQLEIFLEKHLKYRTSD